MTSRAPLLNKRNRKATVVKAAWQLENAIVGKFLQQYPEDIQAARLLHYDCMRFNKWYYRALLALVLLTAFEVPAWCHETQSKDIWTWYPGYELCVVPVEGGDPFLSGLWYLPPGYALIVEIGIEIIVLKKFLLDYELEMSHFVPAGVKFQNTNIIFWGWFLAVGSIVDTAIFTVFRVPIRLTFLFRTGLLFILPGVQSLFSSIFNLKMFTEFMSISVFLWGTMLFFAWISVTTFGSWHEVSYKEDGEPVYINKDLDTLSGAFYSMFVAAVTGEYVDVFLPTLTACRSSGLLWGTFLILAKVLFESLTLDTLVSAYIRGAKASKSEALEIRAEGTLAAFDTLASVEEVEHGGVISKELFLEFVNVFSRSPAMQFVPKDCAEALYSEVGSVSRENFCKVCLLLDGSMTVAPTEPENGRSSFGEMLQHYVTLPEDEPAFDKLMNSVLLVNFALVLLESAYTLNALNPPAWTGYVELVFSFVYLVEVAVKVQVRSWDVYWLSLANRFDFFTTFLLLFSSLLPYLPNSVMPFDLRHYANILRLLRLLRVIKQLKSLRSVQFLAGCIAKMVWAAGNILLMLGCVVFFFMTLGVNLFGGVLYKGNPGLEHTEYKEKHWFVFNFNDTPMAFALFFTQLLCEYVPVNAEALQKTARWGNVAWLIFPFFYFLGVAIMFEILLAFTVEAYIELREESEKEEEEEKEREEEAGHQLVDGHGGHGHEGHGHEGHEGHEGHDQKEKSEKFNIDTFFEEVREKFDARGEVVHYITQDEPNFPKLLQEAFEETIEAHHKAPKGTMASHVEIAKASWQTENAMFHTEWEKYPEDCQGARRDHFRLLQANKLYYKAIIALVILTVCEVPPWCHQTSPNQDMWKWIAPEEWCHVDGNAYLSGIWYIPPGIGLIIEVVIEIIILRKVGQGQHQHVPKEVFLEFVQDLGQSPRMFPVERQTAEIIFEHFGEVTEEKFLDACRVIQNPVWVARKDSCLKRCAPRFWDEPFFRWVRLIVWEPEELPTFDVFMNQVLLANLVLVVAQSAYSLNHMEQPPVLGIFDLIFAFAYVGEVLVKLSVKSWSEYCSFWGNQFDFMTTWLLLFTTLLPYLPFATVQADLKKYANILRLLRLVRVVKQLKQFPRVQFMVATVSRMVNAAGDILQLLGVLLFFFSAFSMNVFGGVLYEGKESLEETEYAKKHLYIFNFNDMSMAFITFFAQLLSEYVPENATALQVASSWGNIAWYIFPSFYILGVAIIFEITKAFTIEYYLAIKEEAEDDDEEKEEEPKGSVIREEMEGQLEIMEKVSARLEEHYHLNLFYTMYNDSYKFQYEMKKAYEHCLAQRNGH